ncbi:hypothetical protein S2M10_06720 [Sphingomonas sp. S2M10]|uniref:hypothetical protein n=1 Tax=Sphingomonas sp. S2M10 TaxID=2705010 RepID=UPI0014566EFD|nr:hypothetical protein [Sphingomonas sp. S2M10]NLS25702.1 hypothetical protein [Sphingomonas sp. S2M10]
MAKAFLLKPLAPVGTPYATTTVAAGQPAHAFNDYAGVTVTLACDGLDNAALLIFDLGADTPIDTVMVFGVSGFPQSGGQFWVQMATAAEGPFTSTYTNELGSAYAGAILPTSGLGVSMLYKSSPNTARYVRLRWLAPSSGQSIRIARVVVGARFQPAINFEYGAQFGVRDLGSLDVNARGVLLRHRGKKLRTVSINFPALTRQEAEGVAQKMLEQVGNTECIALCTDPAADAERQSRCYFGPLVGDLGRTWATAAGHKVPVNLLGIL